jgi:hypothetical protein
MPWLQEIELLFVIFLIVLFFVLGKIAIFPRFALFVVLFVFVIIHIFRDDVQMHGMDLRDFQFGLALWATENLAFFDFVFVDVDFSGTFRAADHGSILRTSYQKSAPPGLRAPPLSVLYTGVKSTPSGRVRPDLQS